MKHFYSEAQKISTNMILAEYEKSIDTRKIDVLGSVYMPLYVFIRITSFVVNNDGSGGNQTEYVVIEHDGRIIRNANVSINFENDRQRRLVFSELTMINRP